MTNVILEAAPGLAGGWGGGGVGAGGDQVPGQPAVARAGAGQSRHRQSWLWSLDTGYTQYNSM